MVDVADNRRERNTALAPRGPGPVEKAVSKDGADDTVACGQRADHLIAQLAIGGNERAAIRVAGDHRSGECVQRLPEALLRHVAEVEDHAQALHLRKQGEARVRQWSRRTPRRTSRSWCSAL